MTYTNHMTIATSVILFGILGIIFALALVMLWIFIILIYTRVPYVKTPKKNIDLLLQQIHFTKEDVVFDLGCGDADVLIAIDKSTGAKTYGFEISPFAFCRAWFSLKQRHANTKVYFKDFHSANLQKATYIFVFLITGIMNKTAAWIESRAPKGVTVISYGFTFPDKKPITMIKTDPTNTHASNFYIYKF